MQFIDAIGFASATLTTASFLPQVWHTWRTRDVSGISLWMYSMFTVGVAGWLAYGFVSGAWPVIIANAITLLLACIILALKIQVSLGPLPLRFWRLRRARRLADSKTDFTNATAAG